ncbi:MAG: immunoglobulin domain-containing protein, partial [Limisphaerales bacterium]
IALIGVPSVTGSCRGFATINNYLTFATWGNDYISTLSLPVNSYRIGTLRFNTNANSVDLFDRTASASNSFTFATSGQSTPGAGYYLGGMGPQVRCFAGDIAEFITYRGALSDADRLAVQQYLQQKYYGVAAAGSSFSYQWQFDGADLPGATNSSLVITNVQFANAGTYDLVVTNFAGATTSSNATLTVVAYPPSIVSQPTNRGVVVGGSASFSVNASGTAPLSYFWQVGGVPIAGATASTLTITNAQPSDAGSYSVVITNAYGSVTSSNAVLTVVPPTLDHFVWSAIPSPQYVSNAFSAVLTAKDASNSTLTSFGGTVNLSAVNPSATILNNPLPTSNSGSTYTLGYAFTPTNDLIATSVRHYGGVKISIWTDAGAPVVSQTVASVPGTWRETALTNPVTLYKNTRYRIGAYYQTGAPYYYITTPLTTFANGSINGGYYGSGDIFPTTSWTSIGVVDIRYSVGGTTNIAISPVVSGPFVSGVWTGSVAVLQTASNVVLRADDGAGHSGLSGFFDVTALEPRLVTQPVSRLVGVGSNVTFTVTAAGLSPLTYQWLNNGGPILGATTSAYSITNVQLTDAGTYAVIVTNGYGSVTSSNAVLSIDTTPPSITAQPSSKSTAIGGTASFSVTATGALPLNYTWRRDGTTIAGATASSYTISNVQVTDSAALFSCLVTNAYGTKLSSNAVLTVTNPPGTTIISQNNTTVTIDNPSGRIYSVAFRGIELYRVGTYVSDWGLQTGTNSATFVRNENGSGSTGQPMIEVSSNSTSAAFTGTYTAGGANIALTRSYTLLPGTDLMRVSQTFQNNGTNTLTLRCFDTFDPDWSAGGIVSYGMAASRYTVTNNGVSIQIGRGILTNDSTTVLLATQDPAAVLAASATYFGILNSSSLNTLFATGGTNSGGGIVDASLDIARQSVIAPGASVSFVYYHSIATSAVLAEAAVTSHLTIAPVFSSIAYNANGLNFNWAAMPGNVYQLQYKSDLTQTNWSIYGTYTAAGNNVTVSDSLADGQRFYRVMLLP